MQPLSSRIASWLPSWNLKQHLKLAIEIVSFPLTMVIETIVMSVYQRVQTVHQWFSRFHRLHSYGRFSTDPTTELWTPWLAPARRYGAKTLYPCAKPRHGASQTFKPWLFHVVSVLSHGHSWLRWFGGISILGMDTSIWFGCLTCSTVYGIYSLHVLHPLDYQNDGTPREVVPITIW